MLRTISVNEKLNGWEHSCCKPPPHPIRSCFPLYISFRLAGLTSRGVWLVSPLLSSIQCQTSWIPPKLKRIAIPPTHHVWRRIRPLCCIAFCCLPMVAKGCWLGRTSGMTFDVSYLEQCLVGLNGRYWCPWVFLGHWKDCCALILWHFLEWAWCSAAILIGFLAIDDRWQGIIPWAASFTNT